MNQKPFGHLKNPVIQIVFIAFLFYISFLSFTESFKSIDTKKFQSVKANENMTDARWIQNADTIAGNENGRKGSGPAELDNPESICVDDDGTIYIADMWNHRIIEWKQGATRGRVVAGGNGRGNRDDQLSLPTHVIVDKETDNLIICDGGNQRVMHWSRENRACGEPILEKIKCSKLTMDDQRSLYISDWDGHQVTRYRAGETDGTVVAGGNGKGDRLNQLHKPTYIFVDQEYSVYVADTFNHRVMKWVKGASEGIIVAGGRGPGNASTHLTLPRGIFVDLMGTLYVADCENDRVMRWPTGATAGDMIVGGDMGRKHKPYQVWCPVGMSFDKNGNMYLVDWGHNRIQKFSIE